MIGFTLDEITEAAARLGEPAYRGRQIYAWIYARRATSFEQMTNLPAGLRARLAAAHDLRRPRAARVDRSADGTLKYLWEVPEGRVESVLMPEPSRVTLCVSSQMGCALDCRFCLTALMGFGRNLSSGEIVAQALAMLDEAGGEARRANVVFMGMGEPLHNYDQVLRAFRILADPGGVGIPRRRVTVSTAGWVPGIRRLAGERVRPRLAISLNATTDEVRSSLMPVNRRHPLKELLETAAAFPLGPRERITFEHVMLEGVNAAPADADRLAVLVRRHGLRAKVNLIPFNPGGGLPFRSPPLDAVRAFRDRLLGAGIPCSIRKNRGRDILAACGQLAAAAGPPPGAAAAPASPQGARA
jgi:23S rRNA (adenine2503-C2)-methyltransferase